MATTLQMGAPVGILSLALDFVSNEVAASSANGGGNVQESLTRLPMVLVEDFLESQVKRAGPTLVEFRLILRTFALALSATEDPNKKHMQYSSRDFKPKRNRQQGDGLGGTAEPSPRP